MNNLQAAIYLLSLIERVQEFGFATHDRSETAVDFHEAGAAVGKKTGPVALASEHLFKCNARLRTTMRWSISSFRAILR